MTRALTRRGTWALCWGLFGAWAVHDLEEVFSADLWSRHVLGRLRAEGWPGWLVDTLTTSSTQFALAAVVVGVAVVAVARHGARGGGRPPLFRAAVLVFGWHGVVHIAQAVVLGGYVPGVITSAVLVIPYAAWAWRASGAVPGAGVPRTPMIAAVAVASVALAFAGQSLARLILG